MSAGAEKNRKFLKLFFKNPLHFSKKCAIIYPVAQGYSSAGRVPVSKTVGRGFESSCPCQTKHHRKFGGVFVWHEVRGETRVQAASNSFVSALLVQLDELATGEFGVQNPPAPAKEKSAFVRMRIFLCIIHYSLFIIHYSFVPHAVF